MDYLNKINKDYTDVSDLITKNVRDITIVYVETICDQTKINNYILKYISTNKTYNLKKYIPSPNVKIINNYRDLKKYLNSGFTIVLDKQITFAVETKADISRSVDMPTVEPTIFGPKDALTENYQTNLGLIKRRIKSHHLKNKEIEIGRFTTSISSILYLDNVAKKDIINKVFERLSNINIDGINDIRELKKYLINEDKNVFPAFKITERPDVIATSLLNGKIVVLLDTSPYALIIPSFLADFINPISDDYTKNINVNFLKILRLFCFFLSITIPAIYVAVTTYNQETIPTPLLLNIQAQREPVPFPALVECIITLIICEILRESDTRFPSSYGSAISILGALVLGEAAVSAGIVSPIMIIVVAITFISSLIFTDLEIINAIRIWRFLFLFICSIYGLYGICIMFILFIANVCNYEVLGEPYLYPVAPFDMTYIKDTLLSLKNKKRSKILSKNRYKGEK